MKINIHLKLKYKEAPHTMMSTFFKNLKLFKLSNKKDKINQTFLISIIE